MDGQDIPHNYISQLLQASWVHPGKVHRLTYIQFDSVFPHLIFFYQGCSRVLSHGSLLNRSLNRPKSDLLKPSAVILLFALLLPLRIWTLWSHGHCSQVYLQPSHFQQALVCEHDNLQSISHFWPVYHLDHKVVPDVFQKPAGWLKSCCAVPPTGISPQAQGPENAKLLLSASRRSHSLVLPEHVAYGAAVSLIPIPLLPILYIILTHKLSVYHPPHSS